MESAILSELLRTDIDPGDNSVLDIGPESGHWIDFWLDFKARNVTSIEISDEAADALNSRYEDNDAVTIEHADICTKHAEIGQYDIVTAIGVKFHMVSDDRWERAISDLCSALNAGGVAIIGGQFDFISTSKPFHGMIDFDSPNEHSPNFDGQVFVNKRPRSHRRWKKAIKKYGGEPVGLMKTPIPIHFTTPRTTCWCLRSRVSRHFELSREEIRSIDACLIVHGVEKGAE